MEITYYGHSCFKIKGKEVSLVIDPYDSKIGYKVPKLEADIVLTTHDHFDHNNVEAISNYELLINCAGEYEKKGVFITGVPTFHDDKKGEERGTNTMYLIDVDGIRILHLGDLGHSLTQDTLESISEVDVLMIPVGGKYTIDAEVAASVISEIEPGIVIPMHYKTADGGLSDIDTVDKFLTEMGAESTARREDKLKLSSHSDIPGETAVVVLNRSH